MEVNTINILLLLGGVVLAIVVLVFFLSMFSGASTSIAEYSYKKEIGNDVARYGYQLISISPCRQGDTIWKTESYFEDPIKEKTVFRTVELRNAKGEERTVNVKYQYRSYWKDQVYYDPPISS